MGIGTSLFLIAVGAILRFATSFDTAGVNWAIVGDILMIVGAIGLVVSLIWIVRARDAGPVVERDRVVEREVPPAY